MKILVTGSQGRIGSQLVSSLKEDGYFVRGFDLANTKLRTSKQQASQADEFVQGSLGDEEALARACEGIDVILHLGAYMSWLPEDESKLYEANVTGTFNLLRASLKAKVGRFVFASSGEVYPELNPIYQPIDENHPTKPTSAYGLSKLLGEELVQHYGRRGLPYCILRFAHTQSAPELLDEASFFSGPRFYVNAKIRQLKAFPQSEAIQKSIANLEAVATEKEQLYIGSSPDGERYRMGLCDVRDMIQGVKLAAVPPNAAGEVFNIGPSESFEFADAVAHIAEVRDLPVHNVTLHTATYRYDTSIEKARAVLGYAPKWDIHKMIEDAKDYATT